jgi:hypothetical protein
VDDRPASDLPRLHGVDERDAAIGERDVDATLELRVALEVVERAQRVGVKLVDLAT